MLFSTSLDFRRAIDVETRMQRITKFQSPVLENGRTYVV